MSQQSAISLNDADDISACRAAGEYQNITTGDGHASDDDAPGYHHLDTRHAHGRRGLQLIGDGAR